MVQKDEVLRVIESDDPLLTGTLWRVTWVEDRVGDHKAKRSGGTFAHVTSEETTERRVFAWRNRESNADS